MYITQNHIRLIIRIYGLGEIKEVNMKEESKNIIKNVLTIGGAIAIACALLDEADETIESEKLTNGEYENKIKQITDGKQQEEQKSQISVDNKEYEKKQNDEKKESDEIAELKRKLKEYEEKEKKESENK